MYVSEFERHQLEDDKRDKKKILLGWTLSKDSDSENTSDPSTKEENRRERQCQRPSLATRLSLACVLLLRTDIMVNVNTVCMNCGAHEINSLFLFLCLFFLAQLCSLANWLLHSVARTAKEDRERKHTKSTTIALLGTIQNGELRNQQLTRNKTRKNPPAEGKNLQGTRSQSVNESSLQEPARAWCGLIGSRASKVWVSGSSRFWQVLLPLSRCPALQCLRPIKLE